MAPMISRHIEPRVFEALSDTRVVVIQGARQVGKSTLLNSVVRQVGGRTVSLDDQPTRSAAQTDPVGFLEQGGDGVLGVDEIQRVPALVLALKLIVDRDPRPGRFLVTGSANLLRVPAAEDSLAGRAESLELHGFSQGERDGHLEQFIDRLFAGDRFLDHRSTLRRHDYLQRAVTGGYPEVLARPEGRRRVQWMDNYVTRIVQRDAPEISDSRRLSDLPRVLRLLAARNSEELNIAGLSSEIGIPASSLTRLIELLETLYLIQRVPAWSTNLSKRVVSRPKTSLLDTGLAARLVNVSATGAAPGINGEVAGNLLEGFVAGELRRQQGWSEETTRMSHYRDRAAGEVDLILETGDGRVAGIEVKASATVTGADVRWLALMRDRLGARFVGGLVLYTGEASQPFGDRITAAPIDVMWTA